MIETSKLTGERIKEYLSQGKRFDKRKLDEFRKISIETNISKNAEGSARVKIGKTEVLVGVKMDIGEPYPDSPNQGNLVVNAELLPLSSPRFENGPPKFPAIELGRLVDRAVRESKFIEFKKLCIKEREKVWTVFIDVYSINDDGNLFDAASIGAITALKNAKIPKYDEKEEKILRDEPSKEPLPLSKTIPISITIHKIGNNLVVDPTKEEEDLSETRVTIGGSDDTIFSMQKGDSSSLSIEEIGNILETAKKIWKDLYKTLDKFLK